MANRVSLSKFLPETKGSRRPHRVLGKDGRYYFKDGLMGAPLRKYVKENGKASTKLHPSGKNSRQRLKEAYTPTGHPKGFQKGNTHNSHTSKGGNLGFTHKYKLKDLVVAIQEVEEELGENLLVHFVRKGFTDNPILKELMKKLLPDLKHVDADIDLTEQFQLIVDATGNDKDDDIIDAEVVPKQKLIAGYARRKAKRKRHA